MSYVPDHLHCRICYIPVYDIGCLIYEHPITECVNSGKVWFSGSIEIDWFDKEVQEQWIYEDG